MIYFMMDVLGQLDFLRILKNLVLKYHVQTSKARGRRNTRSLSLFGLDVGLKVLVVFGWKRKNMMI
jgi:hypothetical protein